MPKREGSGCIWIIVAAIVIAVWLYNRNPDPVKQTQAEQAVMEGSAPTPDAVDQTVAALSPSRDFDEDRAHDAATDWATGQSYEAVVGSVNCTDGCEGHEAGWQWARDNGDDCDGGSSESFREGCAAYVEAIEERVATAKAAFDKGDDTFKKE